MHALPCRAVVIYTTSSRCPMLIVMLSELCCVQLARFREASQPQSEQDPLVAFIRTVRGKFDIPSHAFSLSALCRPARAVGLALHKMIGCGLARTIR